MELLLVNPNNALVGTVDLKVSRWNRYRVWKPLGLLVVAGATPPSWTVTVVDENVHTPDYEAMPRPDLVGLTAFSSQAPRAYALAARFRARGVPVVMGGVHASLRVDEALERVDAVVQGEADEVWPKVLEDARAGRLERVYAGAHVDMARVPHARHDLLAKGYEFGSIQVSRGCPFDCSFCSVTAFNGRTLRQRPVEDVVAELRAVPEKLVLIVDDNLVGSSKAHGEHAKALFRAMISARLGKRWIGQVTINVADDPELLRLAAESGCIGLFIGFESPTRAGLAEVNKKLHLRGERDFPASVRRIHRHGIIVVGSFIMGLDVDRRGIGRQVARTALHYGVDLLNMVFLTPLPGTKLFEEMEAAGRLAADDFPSDWQYYTLTHPVARYQHLSWKELIEEQRTCSRIFYTYPRIARRVLRSRRKPLAAFTALAGNLSYKYSSLRDEGDVHARMDLSRGHSVIPS